MQFPWIKLSKEDEGWTVNGDHSYHAGHRLSYKEGCQDGVFCSWNWDGKRLVIENDRYGAQPLFYCFRDGQFMMSPSVVQLLSLGAPATYNDAAMAVFARLGFFLGDDTAFEHIHAVPPNATFTFADGKLNVQGAPALIATQDVSYEQSIDGYIEYFRQSIRRRPPTGERFAVPLSGGRDSRHILLELSEQGLTPDEAITIRRYRPKPGDDFSFANAIAQEVGVTHTPIVPSRSFTEYESEKNVLTHMCTDEMWWVIPVAEYADGRFDTLWDGLGGDVLSSAGAGSSASLTEQRHRMFEQGRLEELAEDICGRWSIGEAAVDTVLPKNHRERWTRALAIERITEELRRYDGAGNPVTAFFFWNRARREVGLSPTSIYRGVDTVYLPYLDHDLFDFLSSVPPEKLWGHMVHNEAILKGYPQYAHVPFEDRALQSFGLSMAPLQAVRSAMGLIKLARHSAPHYSPIVRRWAWKKLRRHAAGNMPRRMVHYFIDIEGIRTQQGARDMLARV